MLYNKSWKRGNDRIMRKKFVVLILAITIMISGCGSTTVVDNMDTVGFVDKQTLIDYYAEGLKYDAVITRGSDDDKHEAKYEEYDVTGDKRDKIIELKNKAEVALGNMEYTDEIKEDIPEDVFYYIKGYANDLKLEKTSDDVVTGALGYYFVDSIYTTSERTPGTFTGIASLVGVNGAFYEDEVTGNIYKNDAFIKSALSVANRYFIRNAINKNLSYSDDTSFQINDGAPNINSYYAMGTFSNNGSTFEEDDMTPEYEDGSISDDESVGNVSDVDTVENNTEENNTEENDTYENNTEENSTEENNDEISKDNDNSTVNEGSEDEDSDVTGEDTSVVDRDNSIINEEIDTDSNIVEPTGNDYSSTSDRKVKFDVMYLNSIVGSSASNGSLMPNIDTVYNMPQAEGTIGGIGIYPCGSIGMAKFNCNISNLSGRITLRYVFRDKNDGSGDAELFSIYPKDMENEIPEFDTNGDVLIPEYLEQELENIIERADRTIVNYDLPGMISDSVFDDLGFGILRGYINNGVNILKHMSTIRQVVSRSMENNAYVLEVESTVIEGTKSSDTYGTFRDRSYVVVEQYGSRFKITDWVRISRDTVREPDIDVDNSAIKRLVALNLSGEVSDETKEQATDLLNMLYKASTDRRLNGPYDIEREDGSTENVERGMYDCFNNDVNLLSTEEKEKINSHLRGYLTAYGADVSSNYCGRVDEWIGGSEDQVEFTAEEIILYGDGSTAKYMRTYYLMSCINDIWYIDEMNVIDSEDLVDASEIESIYSRVKE